MSKNMVIYNTKTERAATEYGSIRRFETIRGAKTAIAALVRKSKDYYTKDDFAVMTFDEFQEKHNPMVETRNLLNPDAGPIMIRKSELGGVNDPGTERYHCC